MVTARDGVRRVLADYPRIYFACHRRHVRDPGGTRVLSATQASVLDHLDAVDPTALTALAAHMGVTPSTMSIAVDRLVRAGYVSRARDRADARRVQLRLTDAGVRIRSANSVLDPALVERMLRQLSAADRRRALDGLSLLAAAADASVASAASARRDRGTASASA